MIEHNRETPGIYPPVPSDELLESWIGQVWHEGTPVRLSASDLHLVECVIKWVAPIIADQELKAVELEIIDQEWFCDPSHRLNQLRAARRPKPRTLAEEALKALDGLGQQPASSFRQLDPTTQGLLRHALQRLAELEAAQQPVAAVALKLSPPRNCRMRLEYEGKPHPKSDCEACGTMSPKWRECEAAMKTIKLLEDACNE